MLFFYLLFWLIILCNLLFRFKCTVCRQSEIFGHILLKSSFQGGEKSGKMINNDIENHHQPAEGRSNERRGEEDGKKVPGNPRPPPLYTPTRWSV